MKIAAKMWLVLLSGSLLVGFALVVTTWLVVPHPSKWLDPPTPEGYSVYRESRVGRDAFHLLQDGSQVFFHPYTSHDESLLRYAFYEDLIAVWIHDLERPDTLHRYAIVDRRTLRVLFETKKINDLYREWDKRTDAEIDWHRPG